MLFPFPGIIGKGSVPDGTFFLAPWCSCFFTGSEQGCPALE